MQFLFIIKRKDLLLLNLDELFCEWKTKEISYSIHLIGIITEEYDNDFIDPDLTTINSLITYFNESKL